MNRFVDLSHPVSHGMPGFRYPEGTPSVGDFTVEVLDYRTHEQTRVAYQGRCGFAFTEVRFRGAVGTYLDAPLHRFPAARDIADYRLDQLVLPGIVIDARGLRPFEVVTTSRLPAADAIRGRAVLFDFGWASRYGAREYFLHPFPDREVIEAIVDRGASLVGVDTSNVDDARDADRPAHTLLLGRGIPIVENLASLDQLRGKRFRFFAVPQAVQGAASLPVRAFAEVE
jgi:kynurenine formamidase